MPRALAASPRNRLPPPMTTPTSTPSACTSPISRAICVAVVGSMPKGCSPISASPDSLRRTRLYAVFPADTTGDYRRSPRDDTSASALADFETDETRDADVLAELGDGGLNHLADGHFRIANR